MRAMNPRLVNPGVRISELRAQQEAQTQLTHGQKIGECVRVLHDEDNLPGDKLEAGLAQLGIVTQEGATTRLVLKRAIQTGVFAELYKVIGTEQNALQETAECNAYIASLWFLTPFHGVVLSDVQLLVRTEIDRIWPIVAEKIGAES